MWKSFLLSTVTIFLILAALEVSVRIYDLARGRSFIKTHGNVLNRGMKHVVPFRTFGFDPYSRIDSEMVIASIWSENYSYRKPQGAYRIVCFGGSTTENRVDGIHYPIALQSFLRGRLNREDIEVINVGNSAYATPHSIILLALDVVSWDPDLVIISHNINDLMVMYWPGFRPDYWNKFTHEFYCIPNYAKNYTWTNVVFQNSRLYWFLKHRIDLIGKSIPQPSKSIRRRSYGDLPSAEACEIFERNLKTFIGIAKQRGIDVIVASQPLQPSEAFFLRHMAYKPYNDIVVYPYQEEFVRHHKAFNKIAETVATNSGVRFVDNERLFNGDAKYFTDLVHYTKEGINKLAGNYADFIVTRNMIGRNQSP